MLLSILCVGGVCSGSRNSGYDFEGVKKMLRSLPSELSQAGITTLHNELVAHGHSVAELSSSIRRAVPNAISISFNPLAFTFLQMGHHVF